MEKLSGSPALPTESIRTELGVVGIGNYTRHDSQLGRTCGVRERWVRRGERELDLGLGDSSRVEYRANFQSGHE